MSILCI